MGSSIKRVMEIYDQVYSELDKVLVGQDSVKCAVTTSLLCDKNSKILLTGSTGVGKTALARFLATSFDSERITIKDDLIPSEIQDQLIANPDLDFLHIDEFNRASGKLQSVFIELFAERQMTVNGQKIDFGDFYVFATQNNADIAGIFNVPQAIYDRFDINVSFNNLSYEEKRKIFFGGFKPSKMCHISPEDIDFTTNAVQDFPIDEEDERIIMRAFSIIDAISLEGESLFSGPNIRANMYSIKMAKLIAMAKGRDYIHPCDIADFIDNVYRHRIDQNVAHIDDSDVSDIFVKAQDDILRLKRKRVTPKERY